MSRPEWYVVVVASVALLGIVGPAFLSAPYPEHGDTVWHLELARTHSLTDPRLYAHGQWPGGYLALLRIAVTRLEIHPVHFGRSLSLLGALIAVGSVIRIATIMTGYIGGVIAAAALLANPIFLSMTVTEGTDMPAAGLIALSVAVVGGSRGSRQPRLSTVLASGLILGLAYMIRYTASVAHPWSFWHSSSPRVPFGQW